MKGAHNREPLRCHHYAHYELTCEQFDQLRERAGGKCEICGTSEQEIYRQKLYIDHCHTTGQTRGLLCPKCNTVMACLDGRKPWGANRRWETRAKAYLDQPRPWSVDVEPRCRTFVEPKGRRV